MIIRSMRCIKCNTNDCIDLRYLWNSKLNTYELEYHCTTLEGGCNFYRIMSLNIQDVD